MVSCTTGFAAPTRGDQQCDLNVLQGGGPAVEAAGARSLTLRRSSTERGYADITIEGIAAEAGVGKTTIYRWWSTKRLAIYIDLYSELAAQVIPPPTREA